MVKQSRHELEEWKAGVESATAIARAPNKDGHIESIYLSHKSRYLSGTEEYRSGADAVGEIDLRRRDAEARAERAEQERDGYHLDKERAEAALREWLSKEGELPDEHLHPALAIRTARLLGIGVDAARRALGGE